MKAAGRWSLLAALALLAVAAGVWLYRVGPGGGFFPGCVFRRLTGFYCPGCGMTRATHAALHGEWAAAFRFNPLGVVLFPVAMTGLGLEMIAWARGGSSGFRLVPGPRLAVALASSVIVYWVLRNLPWWPFTLLAPA